MGQFLWRARQPDREDSSDGKSRGESPITVITMVHPTPRNVQHQPTSPARNAPPMRPASPPMQPMMQAPSVPPPAQQQQQQQQHHHYPSPQHKSKSKQRTTTTRATVGEGIHKIEASPAALGVTSPAQAKTVDTASDIHEPTQNFVLLTNKKSVVVGAQTRSPESEGSLLQPVDAISASKSTSGGTRRVYKVVRVAPSKFLTKKEQQAAAEAAARAAGGGGGRSKSKGNKET